MRCSWTGTSANEQRVKAELAIFSAGFVLLTLLVNAPLAQPLLTLLRLDRIRQEQLAMRKKVKETFSKHTLGLLEDLQAEQDDDELLQGLDWASLTQYTDFKQGMDKELPGE